MDVFTLIDAPLQLGVEIFDQGFRYEFVELSEDVDNGIERVVTGGGHPFDFLIDRRRSDLKGH